MLRSAHPRRFHRAPPRHLPVAALLCAWSRAHMAIPDPCSTDCQWEGVFLRRVGGLEGCAVGAVDDPPAVGHASRPVVTLALEPVVVVTQDLAVGGVGDPALGVFVSM